MEQWQRSRVLATFGMWVAELASNEIRLWFDRRRCTACY